MLMVYKKTIAGTIIFGFEKPTWFNHDGQWKHKPHQILDLKWYHWLLVIKILYILKIIMVIWHMMTSSNGKFSALLPFVRGIRRSPVNSPHKSQWRGALMFSLICAWTNSWVNNREAGDLRHHCAHYNVIVMKSWLCSFLLSLTWKLGDSNSRTWHYQSEHLNSL